MSFHCKILIVFADTGLINYQKWFSTIPTYFAFVFWAFLVLFFKSWRWHNTFSASRQALWTSCRPQLPTFSICGYLSRNLFTNLFSKDLFTMHPSTPKCNNIEGSNFTDFRIHGYVLQNCQQYNVQRITFHNNNSLIHHTFVQNCK